jgi:AbrB family looped-hinge helix DNA binding protein
MTTTVRENNVVTIPPEIARELDIRPGTKLEWEKTPEETILLKPVLNSAQIEQELRGAGRRWLGPGDDPVADLIRERRQDDELDRADENK